MLRYECEGDFQWTHLKFSPNGKMILVSTNTSLILLVDAFSGVLLHTFTVNWTRWQPGSSVSASLSLSRTQGHQNTKNISLEASFSPDSKYVFCGRCRVRGVACCFIDERSWQVLRMVACTSGVPPTARS